jgi:hypothetical protein
MTKPVSKKRKQHNIDAFVEFFNKPDVYKCAKKYFDNYRNGEELFQVVLKMRESYDYEMHMRYLFKWVNTHRTARSEMTSEDFQDILNLMKIEEIHKL